MKKELFVRVESIQSEVESNLFLRALWSRFRIKYETKLPWQYWPFKDGRRNEIHFGNMNGIADVSIYYGKRGVINTIRFKSIKDESDIQIIKSSIEEAEKFNDLIAEKSVVMFVESAFSPVGYYRGENISLTPVSEHINKVTIKIKCFDSIDSEHQASLAMIRIMDFLSAVTNGIFGFSKNQKTKESESVNSEFTESMWLDEYPIDSSGNFLIDRSCFNFLDKYIFSNENVAESVFSACRHFHLGRKMVPLTAGVSISVPLFFDKHSKDTVEVHVKEHRIKIDIPNGEMASVFLISALEVCASFDGQNNDRCSQCNRLIYSISKHVQDIVCSVLGVEYMEIIKDYYNLRSGVLHTGHYNRVRATSITIPLLNSRTNSGCDMNHINVYALYEIVGCCIRESIKRYGLSESMGTSH